MRMYEWNKNAYVWKYVYLFYWENVFKGQMVYKPDPMDDVYLFC